MAIRETYKRNEITAATTYFSHTAQNRSSWVILLLALPCCAQQPLALSRPADQFEAITDCDRIVFGEQDATKRIKFNYVYDTLNRRWLIADDRADEITRCLIEQHGWIASTLLDGRRAVEAPH